MLLLLNPISGIVSIIISHLLLNFILGIELVILLDILLQGPDPAGYAFAVEYCGLLSDLRNRARHSTRYLFLRSRSNWLCLFWLGSVILILGLCSLLAVYCCLLLNLILGIVPDIERDKREF